MTRKFVQRLGEEIGPQRDIPAPDVNTNARAMLEEPYLPRPILGHK